MPDSRQMESWRPLGPDEFDRDVTWMPDASCDPGPTDGKHHCTDVYSLAFLLLGLVGLGGVQVYAHQNGDASRLVRGFDFQGRMCGVDVPGGLLYWCQGPDGRFELDYPVCVDACPDGSGGTVPCFDTALNVSTRVPAYKTKRLLTLCLPASRKKAQVLLLKTVGRTHLGMVVRAVTTVEACWPLLVLGGLAGVAVAYLYVRVLEVYAAPLLRASMFCLVLGPLALGASYLRDGASGGTDGVGETGDSSEDLWLGTLLVGLGLLMAAISCCFRGLETAVGCIEAASELFVHEASTLLAPFASFASKAVILVYMLRGLVLMVSCAEITRSNPYGVMRSVGLRPEIWLLIGTFVFCTFWFLELTNALTEYAVAWTTQRWYFTPPIEGRKGRARKSGLCRAYGNALRFHLGSIALGSLIIMITRPLRFTLGLFTQAAQDCNNCFGACIVQTCTFLMAIDQEFIECWDRVAYVDLAISSDGFCRAAKRATKIISNQVPAVAALRGAQLIFVVAGVGFTCVVPVLLIWAVCKSAAYLELGDTFNPQYKKWILLPVGLLCLSIGFTFMLVFDVVADSVLYCFALDQRQHRQHKRQQRSRLEPQLKAPGQGTSTLLWLFHDSTPIDAVEEKQIEYAPKKLRDLINSQDHLTH